MIQVYLVDSNGRRVLYGYGSSILPITAGYEEVEIGTWRPADQSIRGRLKSYLLDSSPELAEPETIISSATQQRYIRELNLRGKRCQLKFRYKWMSEAKPRVKKSNLISSWLLASLRSAIFERNSNGQLIVHFV